MPILVYSFASGKILLSHTAILKNDLEHQTRRGLPLTPMQQVLLTLRFYATASFHQVIGDLFGVSNYAVCKVIHGTKNRLYCTSNV